VRGASSVAGIGVAFIGGRESGHGTAPFERASD